MQFPCRGRFYSSALVIVGLSVLGYQPLQAATHRVQQGESLWTVAKKHNTSVDRLCQLNHLTETSTLQLGQALRLPGGKPTVAKPLQKSVSLSAGSVARILGSQVSVRSGPGTFSRKVFSVNKGTRCRVLTTSPDAQGGKIPWCKVRFGNMKVGWVRSDLLQKSESSSTIESPTTTTTNHQGSPTRLNCIAYVSASSANLRQNPGTGSARVGKVRKNAAIRVVARSNGWYKVRLGNRSSGWIDSSLVCLSPPSKTRQSSPARTDSAPKAYVVKDDVNVRSGPGTDHGEVAQVSKGTSVRILDRKNDWYHVKFANGTTGWMATFLVKTAGTVARGVAKGVSNAVSPIVRTAMKYRGSPYRHGSTFPSRGFDCSGLVYRVLLNNGVRPPRTAAAQYSMGTPVPRSELRPGDLVFFGNTYRRGISHVGIYIGNNNFIHAARPGKGVCVSSLNRSYYKRKYVGAKRIR